MMLQRRSAERGEHSAATIATHTLHKHARAKRLLRPVLRRGCTPLPQTSLSVASLNRRIGSRGLRLTATRTPGPWGCGAVRVAASLTAPARRASELAPLSTCAADSLGAARPVRAALLRPHAALTRARLTGRLQAAAHARSRVACGAGAGLLSRRGIGDVASRRGAAHMCWTDEASDACWEGVRVGFRACGLLDAPPPQRLLQSGAFVSAPPPTQAALRR